MTPTGKGMHSKPAAHPATAQGYRDLALKVTLADSVEVQRAAAYLLKLASYYESEVYEGMRAKKEDRKKARVAK